MIILDDDLNILATLIIQELQKEFSTKYLSKNLINTIRVEKSKGEIKIVIPAETYNLLLFQTKGVVVHTSHGSYASKLDKEGSSFMVYPNNSRKGSKRISPRNHIGYIDRVINSAIRTFVKKKNAKVVSRREQNV